MPLKVAHCDNVGYICTRSKGNELQITSKTLEMAQDKNIQQRVYVKSIKVIMNEWAPITGSTHLKDVVALLTSEKIKGKVLRLLAEEVRDKANSVLRKTA